MYFRTKNFGIEDSTRETFEPVADDSVVAQRVSNSRQGVVVAQKNNVVVIRKDGSRKRVAKFDRDVTALDTSEDLVVCGDEGGCIKVVGSNRSTIRQYREHEAGVNDVKIHNKTMVVSCSDDMRVKIFDICEERSVFTISDNTDYVKSIDIMDSTVFSGSYDRTINGYCLRTFEKTFTHRAKGPVKRMCCLEEGKLAYTTGTAIFVIDTSDPSCAATTRPMHTREVTRMLYYGGRLYTSSLDASIRVMTSGLRLISRIGVARGIVDFNIFDDILYLGLEEGGVLRLVREGSREEKPGFRDRNSELEDEIEFRIVENSWKRDDHVERRLKRFEYKRSMMDAIDQRDIQRIFGVMTFIQERGEFEHALQDLDRETLARILDVVIEFFNLKDVVPVFVECIGMMVRLYEREILDDHSLIQRMDVLSSIVDDELYFQEQNLRTISFLECFRS